MSDTGGMTQQPEEPRQDIGPDGATVSAGFRDVPEFEITEDDEA